MEVQATTEPLKMPLLGVAAASWGFVGVALLLGRPIWSLSELAFEPLVRLDLSLWQWGLYGLSVVLMAYSEGYKGFQRGFSPRVVARAFHLARHPTLTRALLAPFFCIGLFHASKKRLIVSWTLLTMIVALVLTVRLLPYPYRNIIDAGVVVGLGWGLLATILMAARALHRGCAEGSPELPDGEAAPPPVA